MARRESEREERGFSYKRRPKENLKERANMRGGNFDTIFKPKFKVWKPKDGKNHIRIMPPTWKGAKHYGLDIFVNYNIGPDNQSYLSLSKHEKGDDPLAEARREAQSDGEKDFAKALNPSHRILYWIIDRHDEEEGPMLWPSPFTFDKAIANLCIDEDTKDVIEIDHPTEGRDIRFYKEGSGLMTKYDPSRMKLLPASSIHEDEGQEEEWLNYITDHPLPDVLNFYDYDHIKASFNGQAGRDDDDDEKPRGKRTREEEKPSRTRQRAKPADDDDDEDEDEKPRRRASSRKPADDEDDVDDEEVKKPSRRRVSARDEDEDEDEKPARRRARAEPDEDEDEKPARSRSRLKVEDDEEDDEPPPKSRRGKTDEDDEGGRRKSIREKLAARRRSRDDD